MKKLNIFQLFLSIVICLLAGFIGSFFTTQYVPTWYAQLNKPPFNPPNWIFAPVWTTLFILMGIALYLVLNKGLKKKQNREAILLFGIQLIANVLWSFLFFTLQLPLYAFLEIIILWLLILVTIIRFYKISKLAGWLLIPYLFWVSFASILNLAIYLLNR
ncbi:MAG: tryptophan-rich sensory protein [Microgenomates group bacterium]|nr:tryptophan-rich sensory protein [Microgenomates group bacterium]